MNIINRIKYFLLYKKVIEKNKQELLTKYNIRVDDVYNYVAAWEWTGDASQPALHKEALVYENIKISSRSYK